MFAVQLWFKPFYVLTFSNEVNTLIRSKCKDKLSINVEKHTSIGSRPANFYTMVEDYKMNNCGQCSIWKECECYGFSDIDMSASSKFCMPAYYHPPTYEMSMICRSIMRLNCNKRLTKQSFMRFIDISTFVQFILGSRALMQSDDNIDTPHFNIEHKCRPSGYERH